MTAHSIMLRFTRTSVAAAALMFATTAFAEVRIPPGSRQVSTSSACLSCKAQCRACGFGLSCNKNCDDANNPIVRKDSPCGKGVKFWFCRR